MTAPFECEVRFLIPDREAFERRLADRGARIRFRYAFADHYYRPSGGAWDSRTRALRIREHHQPTQSCEVLSTRTDLMHVDGLSFKRSRFPEGKVRLHAGTLEACRAIVDALGFVPWLTVRKTAGIFFEVPDLGELVIEEVEGIGWMGEVEVAGDDPTAAASAIRRKLDLLGVPPQAVLPDPLAAIVAARSHPRRTVYFCGAIRGGRALQPLYAKIVTYLHDRGWEVLTTHVAAPDVLSTEHRTGFAASDIYERDMRWLQECDLVVAEVSVPSLGVGVELATAQHLSKPLICLCHAEVALSALVDGNPGLRVLRYRDAGEALFLLEGALHDLDPRPASEALHRAGPPAG
jgi:adenylate cyclase class IV